jgi:drug/metabolite transporter (DMT)-like permease
LVLWTWYGVANAIFLKMHPQVPSSTWSTLVGVNTLFLVVIVIAGLAVTGDVSASFVKHRESGDSLLFFFLGTLILGGVVSWGGTVLWNRASAILPTSLAGQLIVFETISGLVYTFIADLKLPSAYELLGIATIIGGILIGINATQQSKRPSTAFAGE